MLGFSSDLQVETQDSAFFLLIFILSSKFALNVLFFSQESIKFTTRNSDCRLAESAENYPLLNGSASASLSRHSAPRKGKLAQPDSVLETVF